MGPTLEFYALVAAELQRRDLAMWICDDEAISLTESIDLGEGLKPPGYYVRRQSGLFPAPLPQNSKYVIEPSSISISLVYSLQKYCKIIVLLIYH